MDHDVVKPYEKESDKKVQVRSMFNKIAPYYDFLNRLLTLRIDTIWRKKAIKTLKAHNPQLILDIATGTGDMIIEMSKQLQAKKIIGVDLSPEMLEIGKQKIEKKGLSDKVEMIVGDSEQLDFEDDYFDAITVAFGVRNYANLKKGLTEMQRVLKPEGKLIVLEFTKPTIFPFKQLFNTYFKYILPTIGKFTSKDPKAYQYLFESVQAFPDYNKFGNILRETGYKNITWKSLSFGICAIYHGEK